MSADPPVPRDSAQVNGTISIGSPRCGHHLSPSNPHSPNLPYRLRLLIACAPCSQVVPSRGSTSTAPLPPLHPALSLSRHHEPRDDGRRRAPTPSVRAPTAKPAGAVRVATAAAAQPSSEQPAPLPSRHCRQSRRARLSHDTRCARRSSVHAVWRCDVARAHVSSAAAVRTCRGWLCQVWWPR
jgi:hypothetical protein